MLLSKPQEALALLHLASRKFNVTSTNLSGMSDTSEGEPPNMSLFPSQVSYLEEHLRGQLQHCRALVEIRDLTSMQEGENRHPVMLVDNLHEYPRAALDLQHLVPYPPKVEPIPIKPLFFDAAWNYIEYPGREAGASRKEVPGNESDKPALAPKKGWFGFGR